MHLRNAIEILKEIWKIVDEYYQFIETLNSRKW